MVMPKKTWYYQDTTSPHPDLEIQRNSNQNLRKLLCEYQRSDYEVYTERWCQTAEYDVLHHIYLQKFCIHPWTKGRCGIQRTNYKTQV